MEIAGRGTTFSVDPGFGAKVEELSGEDLSRCYYCLKCSAGCPSALAMPYRPAEMVRLVQLGLKDELLASPQHAERWARHWMDVWRYSDWYGLGAQLRYSQCWRPGLHGQQIAGNFLDFCVDAGQLIFRLLIASLLVTGIEQSAWQDGRNEGIATIRFLVRDSLYQRLLALYQLTAHCPKQFNKCLVINVRQLECGLTHGSHWLRRLPGVCRLQYECST